MKYDKTATNETLVSQLHISEQKVARLELMTDTVPAMIFYLDVHRRYQSYNKTFMNWFNVGPDQAIGMTVKELIGDDAYRNVQPYLDKALAGEPQEFEIPAPGRTSKGWLRINYTPHQTEIGSIIGVIVMATDVTGQVAARQALEESETNMGIAVDLAELGTWSVNATTGLVQFSKRIETWFGFEGELNIDAALNSIHPEDRLRVQEAIHLALTTPEDGMFDEVYRIVHIKDKKERVIHSYARTSYTSDGRPAELRGSARDVTVERNLQLALETEVASQTIELAQGVVDLAYSNDRLSESNQQLLQSNEELAQYAYVASHDLQEPLRKISMFASIVAESEDLPESLRPAFAKIQNSAVRMSSLIRNLLDFSELMKSDRLFEPVDLNLILESVKHDYEALIEEKQATINVESLATVIAVPFQMQQLFYNLVGNALKFVKTGIPPEIKVSCKIDKDLYHITVADNGIGFQQTYADKIFQVFKRLNDKELFAGTGIGLAICKRIVENHHGKIYAESNEGSGASFHILLPAAARVR